MTLVEERSHPAGMGGTQKLYRFENGYGASIVRSGFTYGGDRGLWELGVLIWEGEKHDLTYETPITNDVLGWLTDDEVTETLRQIEALPAPGSESA